MNVFVAPSKTFEDIRRNASWWVPWLLFAICGMAVQMVVTKKFDMRQLMREEIARSSRAQLFESLPRDQQERQLDLVEKVGRITVYAWPVLLLLGGLIAATVLMATFNFVFEAQVSFARSLAIIFYGWLPGILAYLLAIGVLVMAGDTEGRNPRNLLATNLAYFLNRQDTPRVLYGLAGCLSIFGIWRVIIIARGFKINSLRPKLTTGAAVAAVAIWYVLWRTVAATLGWV
jgi:hypothetical protein